MIRLLGAFLLILIAANSFAYKAGQFTPKVPNMEGCPGVPCSCSCTDPYDPRVKSIAGANKGKCLDTCSFRSTLVLNPESSDVFEVANVIVDDQFYIAKIPLNNVKETIIQIEWFGAWPANHFQIRLIFEDFIELIPQDRLNNLGTQYRKDFIWTVMGMGPVNQIYGFNEAANGDIINGYVFASIEDMSKHAITKQNHVVEQYVINLTKVESSRLLRGLLLKGNKEEYKVVYNFGERSCIQEFFNIFDSAINKKNKEKSAEVTKSILNSRVTPSEAIRYFKAMGLFKHSMPDLHREVGIKIK